MLRAARSWGTPPSVLLGTGSGKWSERDRLAAVALQRFEASLCSGCSHDIAAWGTDRDVEVREVVCPFCAATEKAQQDSTDHKPGVKLIAVDASELYDDADEELPDFVRRG